MPDTPDLRISRRTAGERAAYFEGSRSSLESLRDTLGRKLPADHALLAFIGTCAQTLDLLEQATMEAEDIETVLLALRRDALVALYRAWQADDDHKLLLAVRDLFDGQDGELGVLARAGVTP